MIKNVAKYNFSYYDSLNNKPPLLIIHGFSLRVGYKNLVNHLENDFRVIIPDLPFINPDSKITTHSISSYTEYLIALLDTLNLKSVLVYGNSLGGTLALNMALIEPQKVGAMVLRSPYFSKKQFYPFYLKRPFFNLILKMSQNQFLLDNIVSKGFLKIMAKISVNVNTDIEVHNKIREDQNNLDIHSARDFILDLINTDLSLRLSKITQKISILWASKDKILDSKSSVELHNKLPNSIIFIDDKSQHCIATVSSERLSGLIKEFLL